MPTPVREEPEGAARPSQPEQQAAPAGALLNPGRRRHAILRPSVVRPSALPVARGAAAQVRELKAQGTGPSEIAKKLGIGRASVYRALVPTAGERGAGA
jgi:DNA invertase Pin-like site-specific DNA recombinase